MGTKPNEHLAYEANKRWLSALKWRPTSHVFPTRNRCSAKKHRHL